MPLSQTIHFQDVSFVYPSMGEPLFERLSLQVGAGWTGIVGPNGAGKTTLLHLACGHVEPTSGTISRPRPVIDCPQRTDDPPEGFRSFLESIDARGCALRGQLNVSNDWLDRWPTLSHGERKRAQIAVALWRDPRVLAVDEPTNHIDAEARQMLIGALRTFRGVGLLVSHDRQLLDLLCEQCVFIDPPDVTVRPGGYTKGVELAKADQARARHEKEQARREAARLHSEAAARAREANSADRKRSKRHLDKHDSDGRAKINLARVSGKDGQAGRKLRQLAGRLQRTEQRVSAIHVKKERALSAELTG